MGKDIFSEDTKWETKKLTRNECVVSIRGHVEFPSMRCAIIYAVKKRDLSFDEVLVTFGQTRWNIVVRRRKKIV